ncbi:MAG: nucleotide exchange factor GrpE [Thermodesulfobacteriota bacterium]
MSEEKKQEEILEEGVDAVEEELVDGDDVSEEESVEKQLADALADAAEQKDQFLRTVAEFENYKKRMTRERNTAMKYAGEPILREILSTVDNLERAIAHQVNSEGADAQQGGSSLLEGVELTLKSLITNLEKFEVTPIKSVGQPFDPNTQEALTMEASDTVPASHVVSEFEKGYMYKDRLLRAAKVIVSDGEKGA